MKPPKRPKKSPGAKLAPAAQGAAPSSEIVLYQTDDGQTRIQVRFENETVWLTQALIAELFQKDVRTINEHLVNIFEEGELNRAGTIRKFRIVRLEGTREVVREVEHYNLSAILAVGYRVRSHHGTQFRQWATARLSEYLVKGFTLDDERLKQAGGGDYFDELLGRIRDIRSSEKVFWKKVLEIYATSTDYDPHADVSQQFFATVQSKMHWAAHGHTAAEVIAARVDANQAQMGLTSWTGKRPRKTDVAIAKNYLAKEELEALNLIVSLYLDFAELQARSRRTMTMEAWIGKLDDFLRLSERQILTHAGKVSHETALAKAEAEYERFRVLEAAKPSQVEVDFEEAIQKVKQLKPGEKKSQK